MPQTFDSSSPLTIVMLGATGAVGQQVVSSLLSSPRSMDLTTLGRRPVSLPGDEALLQHVVDVHDPQSYRRFLQGQQVAICTLGVGQPSKVSRTEFTHVDRDAVLAFAVACKQTGVKHFQLLSSAAADPKSRSFYLRTKGELNHELVALRFERLSIFQPSMILTPTNRYGLTQALTLAIWPKLECILAGGLRKYRGIPVETLGAAIGQNTFTQGTGTEFLEWDEFIALAARTPAE